ncbi:MAG: ZIP family metal transporter [Candidatus Latescibacterota bacterium]
METLIWILTGTFAMSLFAWIGLVTLALNEEALNIFISFLVSFSAGSLIGGAFFHLIPEAMKNAGPRMSMFIWLWLGFSLLFLIEMLLNWRRSHAFRQKSGVYEKGTVTYLILIADGIHNFIGGLAIAGSFLVSVPVGIITWLIEAAHEIPQELGDFGIFVYGGWDKKQALLWNFITALTIVPGGILAYVFAQNFDTTFLLPFAAGNFIYIAASDLIPEIKHEESLRKGLSHFFSFFLGAVLILFLKLLFEY